MGNMEVINSPNKRKPIFEKLKPSPYKYTVKHQKQSTPGKIARNSKGNHSFRIRKEEEQHSNEYEFTNRYRHSSRKRQLYKTTSEQEKYQHANGSRIANFNDFLIQIKRQLTENSQQYSEKLSEKTIRKSSKQGSQPETKELRLNLRLQNERFELDKYKKLVQRELSKSHSIQNISLQSNRQNQKLLIIKYEENRTLFSQEQNYDPPKERYQIETQRINKYSAREDIHLLQDTSRNNLAHKIAAQKKKYDQILSKSQMLFREFNRRTEKLGHLLYESSCNLNQTNEKTTNRISRISQLFKDIDKLQNNQLEIQSQIKQALAMEVDKSDFLYQQ